MLYIPFIFIAKYLRLVLDRDPIKKEYESIPESSRYDTDNELDRVDTGFIPMLALMFSLVSLEHTMIQPGSNLNILLIVLTLAVVALAFRVMYRNARIKDRIRRKAIREHLTQK